MALRLRDYDNALQQGARIVEGDLETNSVGSAALLASSVTETKLATNSVGSAALLANSVGSSELLASAVTGAKLSTVRNYVTIGVSVGGQPSGTNVFGQATAPVAGTITGLTYVSATTVTAGTFALFGTTAGTIAVCALGTAIGYVTGTGILNAAVAAGDTVTVATGTQASITAYVTFVTAS